MGAVEMVEIWRGAFRETVHSGHAVICGPEGEVVAAWGDPGKVILPRSSQKVVQALPLIETGAADALGLTQRHLALACASHVGAEVHTQAVARWLADLGLGETDLRCGPQEPEDRAAHKALLCGGGQACQIHNTCSGKHAGFLTVTRHIGAGPEYVEPDHPLQRSVLAAWEDLTGETSPGFGIDGCSAPSFASSLAGHARAMASFANARAGQGPRASAQARLVQAMMAHPVMIAGEGRADTMLTRALAGRGVVKFGAEAVYIAILPDAGLGIALKIEDGGLRAAECVIAALLVRAGLLDPADPAARAYLAPPERNRRGIEVGRMQPVPGLFD
ncbi:asparaginase [Tropicimonas sp. IMCC34043]|uniref:asparaginase n=1 Tax=Tropicimonas sp. IMCC34043 TaxID=2248760 RepID=UPI000E22FF91|nr:asparaginase [Tropicimonas sp. IMCC34043]